MHRKRQRPSHPCPFYLLFLPLSLFSSLSSSSTAILYFLSLHPVRLYTSLRRHFSPFVTLSLLSLLWKAYLFQLLFLMSCFTSFPRTPKLLFLLCFPFAILRNGPPSITRNVGLSPTLSLLQLHLKIIRRISPCWTLFASYALFHLFMVSHFLVLSFTSLTSRLLVFSHPLLIFPSFIFIFG